MTRIRSRTGRLPADPGALAAEGIAGVEQMSGHRASVWMVDEETGVGVAIDLWADEEAAANTRQGDFRDALVDAFDADLLDVQEFTVVATSGLNRR